MTNGYVNPTNKNPAPQNQKTLLDAVVNDLLKNINCVRPGQIQSFNAANATAVVRIAQQQVTSISPTGVQTLAEFPLLLQVPVYTMGGGGATVTFPIAKGDECILLFNDRQLDNWKLSGAGLPPSIGRTHDLSDAFALVGIRSFPNSLANISTSEAQLRTNDGKSFVGVNPTTGGVRVHGANVYEWDVNGYGQKVTWTGGTSWTIDNYTTGATVTTNTHPINPPGPP